MSGRGKGRINGPSSSSSTNRGSHARHSKASVSSCFGGCFCGGDAFGSDDEDSGRSTSTTTGNVRSGRSATSDDSFMQHNHLHDDQRVVDDVPHSSPALIRWRAPQGDRRKQRGQFHLSADTPANNRDARVLQKRDGFSGDDDEDSKTPATNPLVLFRAQGQAARGGAVTPPKPFDDDGCVGSPTIKAADAVDSSPSTKMVLLLCATRSSGSFVQQQQLPSVEFPPSPTCTLWHSKVEDHRCQGTASDETVQKEQHEDRGCLGPRDLALAAVSQPYVSDLQMRKAMQAGRIPLRRVAIMPAAHYGSPSGSPTRGGRLRRHTSISVGSLRAAPGSPWGSVASHSTPGTPSAEVPVKSSPTGTPMSTEGTPISMFSAFAGEGGDVGSHRTTGQPTAANTGGTTPVGGLRVDVECDSTPLGGPHLEGDGPKRHHHHHVHDQKGDRGDDDADGDGDHKRVAHRRCRSSINGVSSSNVTQREMMTKAVTNAPLEFPLPFVTLMGSYADGTSGTQSLKSTSEVITVPEIDGPSTVVHGCGKCCFQSSLEGESATDYTSPLATGDCAFE